MKPRRRPTLLLLTAAALLAGVGHAQQPAAPAAPAPAPQSGAGDQAAPPPVAPPPVAPVPVAATPWTPPPLEPFEASYEALYKGRAAGEAIMRVTHNAGDQWRIDMSVHGRSGFASVLGLNIEQSTVFNNTGGRYVPLSQSTVRKGLFLGKKVTGTYDWAAGTAQWTGDLKKERRQPIPLQAGDQSALLLNLAIMRDAIPGRTMQYRYVDVGRVRQHEYRTADATEIVPVGDLSYDALRVWRTNGGNDETIFWIANGVPTPVRILQREDGEDRIDLRLIGYQGV